MKASFGRDGKLAMVPVDPKGPTVIRIGLESDGVLSPPMLFGSESIGSAQVGPDFHQVKPEPDPSCEFLRTNWVQRN